MKFSANLGFLWADRPLPEAIRAAKAAGFAAVEMHWPYAVPVAEMRVVLEETGLPVLGINTVRGAPGDNGLAALPGREAEARAAIDQALDYAADIGSGRVHVMAGCADGDAARTTFLENLRYGAARAETAGIGLVIEPLNRHDAPGYFLRTTDQAREIIDTLGQSSVRLMFDCYHVGRTEGDIVTRFQDLMPWIGHVQIAAVPDRGAPDHGELDYRAILAGIAATGWDTPIGVEYKPDGDTDATLGWLPALSTIDGAAPLTGA
ncbi:MAG: TIM barrel protein [Pseudomonadota bacterium]